MQTAILAIVFLFFCSVGLRAEEETSVRGLYEQAVDLYNQKQFDQALALYKQIIQMAPNLAPAYIGAGLALNSNGGANDEVLYYYKTATDRDPTNTQALEQLGRLYYAMNQHQSAEKVFQKALKIDPGLSAIKLSLAWIYLSGKPRPELAIKYFQDALKTFPTPETYYGLGMAYFANNDRVEAMDMITRLKNMGHDDLAGRLEQAVRENRRVVINNEPDPPLQNATNPSKPPVEAGIKVRLRGKLSDI